MIDRSELPLPFGAVEDEVAEAVARFKAVLDGTEFRSELGRLAEKEWRWGTPLEVSVRALKAHRRRCTFDVTISTASGRHGVIAKVHNVDRSDAFRTMDAVWRAGFSADAECAIPQPLAYLSSLHIMLEEKVEGPPAMEVFLAGDADEQLATADRCGRWLARFHAAAPCLGDATDQLRLERWTARIRPFGEPLASAAELLLRTLEGAAPTPDTVAWCAGHGSYMPEHVLLSGPRTVTIDFDEYDVADPGRDLAWFIVSLQRLGLKHRGSLRFFDAAVEEFLRAYAASGPAGATVHVAFYRAAECLHRAWRDLYKRIPPIREWAQLMLEEGLS